MNNERARGTWMVSRDDRPDGAAAPAPERRARPSSRHAPMPALACAVLALATLAGCAGRTAVSDPPRVAATVAAPSESERRVAAELVDVLSRIAEVSPARATNVRIDPQAGEPGFGRALESALLAFGYAPGDAAVRDSAERALPIGYAVQRGVADGVRTTTYTVAFADVQARRAWSLPSGADAANAAAWFPAGPLYVRGADIESIEPAPAVPADPPSGEITASGGPDASPGRVADAFATLEAPGARGSTDDRVAGSTDRIDIDPATGQPVYGGLTADALGGGASLPTERNVMDLGDSNFSDLFLDYADVTERILVFGNDSVRMGADNKAIVAEVAERFDPVRDVFSIVGCSLGPTALANGNERLALGRANRVKEELVQVGVPSDRILDEGCWAGDSSERFPSRGVVLTLRRQS